MNVFLEHQVSSRRCLLTTHPTMPCWRNNLFPFRRTAAEKGHAVLACWVAPLRETEANLRSIPGKSKIFEHSHSTFVVVTNAWAMCVCACRSVCPGRWRPCDGDRASLTPFALHLHVRTALRMQGLHQRYYGPETRASRRDVMPVVAS